MGQYWKIVNIDKKRQVYNPGGLKLCEILYSRSAEQLVGLLRRRPKLRFRIPSHCIQSSKIASSSSPLIKLPQEIIDAIVFLLYDNRDSRLDLICLSMTCSYFFRLMVKLLQDLIVEDFCPWPGDRLIFIGDYAANYPEGIATAAEEAEWGQLGKNVLYNLPTKISAEGRNARIKSYWPPSEPLEVWGALLESAEERLQFSLQKMVTYGSYEGFEAAYSESRQCVERFKRLIDILLESPPRGDDEPSEAGLPVLRNLTTKQYVRDDALAQSEYAYSLGEVVVVYTLWTSDPTGTEGLGCKGE
ncbi:hypothetical protein SCHPADRAFT_902047 [Schizopora paradoxa]|uniref:F-box domain-containing protein n=1 Tax=Schizopora paradoxa TaxID=27342 RepID=A0A0H2S203_9AGAM|nr:hypothetical protein SCHPADRAFT_902047 [Schizopora paradoxa]